MSERFGMDTKEWASIGKGLLIAAVGAGLTYLTQWISGADFGDYTPMIVAALSVLTNLVRKWTTVNK